MIEFCSHIAAKRLPETHLQQNKEMRQVAIVYVFNQKVYQNI